MTKRKNLSISNDKLKEIENELSKQKIEFPKDTYGVVVIDPPWPMRKNQTQSCTITIWF